MLNVFHNYFFIADYISQKYHNLRVDRLVTQIQRAVHFI